MTLTRTQVDAFAFFHGGMAKDFDGFVVTHSPVLCRFFEPVNESACEEGSSRMFGVRLRRRGVRLPNALLTCRVD
jgi:hypothetical protein